MPYLLKTEPDVYSFHDLVRDKETIWDGVTNPAAVKFLREMKKGDRLVIYHTGDERTAIGTWRPAVTLAVATCFHMEAGWLWPSAVYLAVISRRRRRDATSEEPPSKPTIATQPPA